MESSANAELGSYAAEHKTGGTVNAYLDLRDENQKLFLHKTGFKVLLQ
jgi:hypothetical protein